MKNNGLIIAILCTIMALIAQIIFETLCGHENMIIGLMMMMSAYSLLDRDFTIKPFYNFLQLLILNCILVIAAYLNNSYTEISLFINIITIFTVNYIYMNEFEIPISFVFIMNYIIMWASPVSLDLLYKRIFAVLLGTVIIILSQLILNNSFFTNKTRKLLYEIINNEIYEIDDIINNIYSKEKNIELNKKILELISIINYSSYKRFYYTVQGKIILNISILLERINIIIDLSNDNYSNKEFIKDFNIVLLKIFKYLKKECDLNDLEHNLNSFKKSYIVINDLYEYELIEIISIFKENVVNLNNMNNKDLKKINNDNKITKEFTIRGKIKRNFSFDSMILQFSIKLAIIISLGMYIVDRIHLPYGKWIVITMYVIMQPYNEDTIVKSKNRIKGTLIGVIVFSLSFYALCIINEYNAKQLMLTLGIFLYSYFTSYDKKVIAITIICLSSVITNGEVQRLSFNRVIYILIGILIVKITNKYLFPYNIYDSIRDLKKKYNNLLKLILIEIKDIMNGKQNQDKIIRLILLCNEVDRKITSNSKRINSYDLDTYLMKMNFIMIDIRYLVLQHYYFHKGYFKNSNVNKMIIEGLYKKLNSI